MLAPNYQTTDELIKQYVETRDALARETKRFNEHIKKHYREPMDVIETELMERLRALGGNKPSLKTGSGTAFTTTTTEPKIVDRERYLDQVMENYSTWGAGMLQLRSPKVEAIHEYMQANGGHLPEGVEITKFTNINVRKA